MTQFELSDTDTVEPVVDPSWDALGGGADATVNIGLSGGISERDDGALVVTEEPSDNELFGEVEQSSGEDGRVAGSGPVEQADSLFEPYKAPEPPVAAPYADSRDAGTVGRYATPKERYTAIRATHRKNTGAVSNPGPEEDSHADQVGESDGGEPPRAGEVEEASDDEHERALGESIAFAKSTAVIHTSVPGDAVATLVSPDRPYGGGFISFGKGRGAPSEGRRSSNFQHCGLHQWNDGLPDSCEAISFFPAKETVYERREVEVPVALGRTRSMLNMKPRTIKQMQPVAVGEKQHMVVNPGTGEEEPGVWVDYEYNTQQLRREPDYDEPKYIDSSYRSGNILRVQTLLPGSLAQGLRQAVRHQPTMARTFAEQLARDGGISQSLWDHPKYPARPPYGERPIYIVTPSDSPRADGKYYALERLLPRR